MYLKHRIYRLLLNLRQRTSRLFCVILACLTALFGLNPSANADIFRVATNGSCTGDGSGWNTNAFRYLQDALDAADNLPGPHEIWVRAGTYFVDQSCANEVGSGDRAETFQMVRGVFLLAGFDGTELDADERDPVANLTILSGAVAQGQDPPGCAANMQSCFEEHGPGCLFEIDRECCERVCFGDNPDLFCCVIMWDAGCVQKALQVCGGSYHIVTAGSEIDDPEQTMIDGFRIRDGWANGTGFLQNQGGGMLIRGEPSVVRCTFTQNAATDKGGGMSITGDFQAWIINCTFEDNPGDQPWTPTIGGGLANSDLADPIVTNSLFVGNAATGDGGGIFSGAGTCTEEACAHITLINCTVVSNTADADNDCVGTGGGL